MYKDICGYNPYLQNQYFKESINMGIFDANGLIIISINDFIDLYIINFI